MNRKKVLVVVDAQNDFITGVLGSKEAEEAAVNIVDYINNEDWDLILTTQDIHDREEYFNSREGKKIPTLHCEVDRKGSLIQKDIHDAIKNKQAMSYPLFKNTFSISPYEIDCALDNFFKNDYTKDYYFDGIDFYFCGFCTDICVISNVFTFMTSKRNLRAYNTFYIKEDCCAGSTPEKHKAALEVMKSCLVEII